MTSRFEVATTPIEGLLVLKRRRMADERGHFSRLFCAGELAEIGWRGPVAQVNESVSRFAGTVRGMHFQTRPSARSSW